MFHAFFSEQCITSGVPAHQRSQLQRRTTANWNSRAMLGARSRRVSQKKLCPALCEHAATHRADARPVEAHQRAADWPA